MRPLTIALTVRKDGDGLAFDFAGSSPPCLGPMNSVRATTLSSVYLAVRHVFPDVPLSAGAFAPLVQLVTDGSGQPVNGMYFWLAGALSSFLDNAPTYLVFFSLAGGEPQQLMTTLAPTLLAISAGAVFMGANTYIGNAPNFMVKAIAEDRGIPMPGFFGYMLWSGGILLPIFIAMTWAFFL